MTLPNFFIVGAPKAGTDELYYHLDQHPQIFMSPLKEPCFFSSEIRPEHFHPSLRGQAERMAADTRRYLDEGMPGKRFGGIVSSLDDYQLLFSRATDQKAVGEGSVCYLWSKSAPLAIASTLPRARIIIVLMDPAERAFRQYLKSLSDGTVGHSFRVHLEAALRHGSELGLYHPFLQFGNYFEQVRLYRDHFPAGQLHLSLYEDLSADRQAWFRSVLSFLGVDREFVPEHVEIPSQPHVPRLVGVSHALRTCGIGRAMKHLFPQRVRSLVKRALSRAGMPRLRPEDRAILVDYYRNDILELQDLLGRDLQAWLK